jgi:glycosyltransferase involved in cell wall biosynthesis
MAGLGTFKGQDDPAHRFRLQQRSARLGVSASVFLLDKTDHPELLISAHNAFALLSRLEGSPAVLAEARAAGLPAVISDFGGGGQELLSDRSGFVVKSPHEAALAINALRDPELRRAMGRQARDEAASFRPTQVARRYLACYQDAICERGTPPSSRA